MYLRPVIDEKKKIDSKIDSRKKKKEYRVKEKTDNISRDTIVSDVLSEMVDNICASEEKDTRVKLETEESLNAEFGEKNMNYLRKNGVICAYCNVEVFSVRCSACHNRVIKQTTQLDDDSLLPEPIITDMFDIDSSFLKKFL
eukprot:TRINITY_DN6698_c0_g1_i1.p1 TRINITY_DN6698_c0_g1~~TRINITY_DN6698_c0_g1_i1.p1  ORF type:complete len:142 (+),score=12.83 TRINITY_DN6698_c0_g1_i1:91-516(+)